jgi:hypothetical protein
MGTVGPFPGAKARPGRDADHSAHLAPRSRMSRSYTSSPPKRPRGLQWDFFSFFSKESESDSESKLPRYEDKVAIIAQVKIPAGDRVS